MNKPAKMRLSSGYQFECPCGALLDSYTPEVCCLNCRREFCVSPKWTPPAPARIDLEKFTVHQRAVWTKLHGGLQ